MNSQINKREVIKIKRNKTLSGLMSLFILTVCMGCSGTPQSKPVLKWLVPGQRSNEFDLVERKINEITEKKLGVGVKFDFVPSEYDYANRINAKIESGEEFDLFFTGWIDLYNLKVYGFGRTFGIRSEIKERNSGVSLGGNKDKRKNLYSAESADFGVLNGCDI